MAFSPRTIRIIAASALSVVLIAGAYVISGPNSFFASKFANAQSSQELLKAYAAKDSDNDGLPDWQEALYGTDPNNAHSVSQTLTDSEAVSQGLVTPKTSASIPNQQDATTSPADILAEIPGESPTAGSLTDQFGQEFMQDFEAASPNGEQLSDDQQQALINQLMTSYSQKAAKLLGSSYTSVSLTISPSTSVTDYAGAVEQILRDNDVPTDSNQPIPLMQAYIQNNDTSALPKLVVLGNSYAAITKALLATPVPPSLANQHLMLVQSFDTMAHATKAAASYQTDPLAVMGSLTVLPTSAQNIVTAFKSIAQVISANGTPEAGAPGSLIVQFVRSTEQPQ